MANLHCLVVGGGIFGLSGAIELRQRGHRVTLFDPGPLPHPEASSNDISKVIRMDYGADEFYCRLAEQAMDGWRAYNQAWPEPLFHERGFCILSSTPLAPGTFEGDSFALLERRGHPLVRLDAEAISARFPAWRPGRYIDGYFNPRAGWAESGRVVAALATRARELGVVMHPGSRVAGLRESERRVTGIRLETGETSTGDTVLVAAGAWTIALVPELADMLPVIAQPVIHLRPADPEPFSDPQLATWAADIQKTGFYGFPANADGLVKVANHGPGIPPDMSNDARFQSAWPDDADERFRDFLCAALPGLADAPIVHRRLCRYSDSRDGDFLIAAAPERPGLVVAAGGSGHGFKFAPVLGRLIADAVEGRDNPWAARFAWRTSAAIRPEAARHASD